MILPFVLMLAQSAAPVAQPAPAAAPAAAEKPKLICVMEDQTGSRMGGKRVCRTKAEWDQMRMDLKQEMNLRQRNNASVK